MKHDSFWRSQGISHLTPQNKPNPEGWDVFPLLRRLCRGRIVEMGCGTGRLCEAFPPDQYVGIDISEAALASARWNHRGYRFELPDGQAGDTALLYTVLLHIADDDLADFVAAIPARRVVVAEVMGRAWRREGNPPVYNREPAEYEAAFSDRTLVEVVERPYLHYKDTTITFMVFDDKPDGRVRPENGRMLQRGIRAKAQVRR